MVIARKRLIAAVLWIVWAIVVWNLVFDQVLIFTARDYITAALNAAAAGGAYARIDDWMRPAIPRAFWLASAAAGLILVVGFVAIGRASRAARDLPLAGEPCSPPIR